MKALLYISIGIAGIVFLSELAWLGDSSLAPVIMGLCIAIGLQGIYLIKNNKE
jgi:hypothetical protein